MTLIKDAHLINVRPLAKFDINQCLRILIDVRSLGNLYVHMWSLSSFRAELEEGGGFGAFDSNGRLQSFLVYRNLPDWFEITNLATNPWAQKQGLMTRLIELTKSTTSLRSALFKSLKLEVHQENKPAIKTYLNAGFIIDGQRKNYYGLGQHAVLMSLPAPGHKVVELGSTLV